MDSDYLAAVYDLTGRLLETALRKGIQGAELRPGNTKCYDVLVLDSNTVVGGNVLLKVNVRKEEFPRILDYYELAATLPRLPDAHYTFPHPDFEIDGFRIRPVIDIDPMRESVILLLSKY